MRVLFDTNVLLDVLLARHPHVATAAQLLDRLARRQLDGLLGATTVTTIHYLADKAAGRRTAQLHVARLLSLFEVAAVGRRELEGALGGQLDDYEDAVLHEAARSAGAHAIVTRDPDGFARARIRVYAPGELLRLVDAQPRA